MMLATLAETVEKTGWLVHAWVWMSNHYHLLVETPEANLVKGMTWFQTTYTTRFKRRRCKWPCGLVDEWRPQPVTPSRAAGEPWEYWLVRRRRGLGRGRQVSGTAEVLSDP